MKEKQSVKPGKEIEFEPLEKILYKNSIDKKLNEKRKNKLINELGDNLSNAEILYSSIDDLKRIRYFLYKNKTPQEAKEYILKLIKKHSAKVGLEQATKDLQRGLSILNKNRKNSPIEAKNILVEDGIFKDKTKATLEDVCKNYSLNVIKKYILIGIMNNIIFDTKNKSEIDTKKMLKEVVGNLRGY